MGVNNRCHVKVGQTLLGEKSFSEILLMLSSGVIDFNTKIRLSHEDRWAFMLNHQPLALYTADKLMLASTGSERSSLFTNWYVRGGQTPFGPFSLLQMLEFYVQKRLYKDNRVRHSMCDAWAPFGESGPFAGKSLDQLLGCEPLRNIITRRKTPRIKYTREVFISAGGDLYEGTSSNLSLQGLGVVVEHATSLVPGQTVNAIIKASHGQGSVQVKGRVVNLNKQGHYERFAIQFQKSNERLTRHLALHVPRL